MVAKKIKLFGKKTEALFDYWSFGHAIFYFFLTKYYLGSFSLEKALLVYVVIAYSWELIERSLEDYDFNHHKRFFKDRECWQNRYIGDLLSGLVGFFLAYYYF